MMLNEVVHLPPPPPPPPEDDSAAMASAPRFPTYLLPSFSRPFRRYRQTSSPGNAITQKTVSSLSTSPADSVSSSRGESTSASSLASPASPASPTSSWFSHVKDSFGHPSAEQSEALRLTRIQVDTIRCSTCGTDFAFSSQIVSKGFTGRYGRAYLVASPEGPLQKPGPNLMNIKVGKPETRVLTTGTHVVCDIQCTTCRARVGWKYVDAKEESQKYKVGKFILETQRTVSYSNWDDTVADGTLELEFEEQEASSSGHDTDPAMFDSDDSDDCDDLFAGVWDAKTAAKRRTLKMNRRWK